MILYHYTCLDRAAMIDAERGLLRPGQDGFLWLTDLDHPYREALGLTSTVLQCDRTEAGYRLDDQAGDAVHWARARRSVPALFRDQLEAAPGVMPMHWWIAAVPIRGERCR